MSIQRMTNNEWSLLVSSSGIIEEKGHYIYIIIMSHHPSKEHEFMKPISSIIFHIDDDNIYIYVEVNV